MVSSMIILALASAAAALQVTSPSKSSVWTAGESQTITWDSVSTDEDTFSIYLSNQVEYPPVSTLLVSDVSKDAGSATIDGSKLTAGDSFTINFTNGDKTEQIYAQSVSLEIFPPVAFYFSVEGKKRKRTKSRNLGRAIS